MTQLPASDEVDGAAPATTTRLVVSRTARPVTASMFAAAGLPVPAMIRRIGAGVILHFPVALDRATRAAVVRQCKAPDPDTAQVKEQAVSTLAALQAFLDNTPAPDQAALDQARVATAAFLAAPPVVPNPPDQATVAAVLAQVEVLSRALLADRSVTAQTRRLTRIVAALVRIIARGR